MPDTDPRSLSELMRIVRARTTRASELIAASDDPEVVDREFRYIRPFWEFYTHRKRVNSARFWNRIGQALFPSAATPWVARSPLLWLPRADALRPLPSQPTGPDRRRLLSALHGLDGALFNFVGLMGRMRYTLALGDDESFDIETTEQDGPGHRLTYRILSRPSASGTPFRIITCRFQIASGESLKLERDYSQSGSRGVNLSVRLSGGEGEGGVGYDGAVAELKSGRGGSLRVS